MTISGVGFSTNNLQSIRAQNAFQKTLKSNQADEKLIKTAEEDVKVSISSKNLSKEPVSTENIILAEQKNSYISEIRQFADKCNITDIEDEDIQDALKYGTSLLADYTA